MIPIQTDVVTYLQKRKNTTSKQVWTQKVKNGKMENKENGFCLPQKH